ncbi:MAG: hypothetical protein MUF06_12900 [Pirellulaceae bacterium]|nr:hypothetical protein [Pirellulaceae bacterium]
MPEIALTPQQQRFLDNYIREHRVLGRKKKADAEKFLRRKGKVLDEMHRLPDEHIPPRFREELQQADALATAGKFSDAYHLLKSAKNELRTVQCDCKPEINSLTQEVETFVTKALKAAAKWQEFEQWRRASYVPQFGNIQQTLSEGADLEPPSAESEQRKGSINLGNQPVRASPAAIESMQRQWLEEQLAAIDRKEAAVKELDADMGRYSSKHSIISMFLEEAARKMPDFSARIADLQRWSQNSPEDQKAIRAISQQLSGRRELLCLQDPPGKFLPSRSFNSFIEQHATAVDGWRQELARQRVEVHRKVAVKSGVSGQMHEALTAASAADQSLKAARRLFISAESGSHASTCAPLRRRSSRSFRKTT